MTISWICLYCYVSLWLCKGCLLNVDSYSSSNLIFYIVIGRNKRKNKKKFLTALTVFSSLPFFFLMYLSLSSSLPYEPYLCPFLNQSPPHSFWMTIRLQSTLGVSKLLARSFLLRTRHQPWSEMSLLSLNSKVWVQGVRAWWVSAEIVRSVMLLGWFWLHRSTDTSRRGGIDTQPSFALGQKKLIN